MQQRAQTGGRGRAYVFLGFSLLAAAVVTAIVWQLVAGLEKQARDNSDAQALVNVVVAARDLNMGVALSAEDVIVRSLPPSVVVDGETFDSVEKAIGRTPKERILANEILRRGRLAIAGEGVGLNALIASGNRAMAVQVSQAQAVAAFIQPGNYVDVIVVIRPDDRQLEAKAVSKVLLQGKRVLAVGSTLQGNESGDDPQAKAAKEQARKKPVVTLEVTLDEAEQMALAAAKGDIHLVLRADVDLLDEIQETEGATASVLIGFDQNQKKPPQVYSYQPKIEGPRVELIQGVDRDNVEFDANGAVKDQRGGHR